MKQSQILYEGSIRKKYLFFAIPLILSSLISQSYSFINLMMIGKFLGSEAFAATAVTAELLECFNSIFYGYLTGVGIYVSILFGKRDYEKMLNVIKVNFLITFTVALMISLTCNIFLDQIFNILNVNDEVYKNAEIYFRIFTSGYVIHQFLWGLLYFLNGMGNTVTPMVTSIITGVINIALNYLFLAVLNKGIAYSAISTLISSTIAVISYFTIFIKFFKNNKVRLTGFKFSKEMLKKSIDYGIPSMIQQMSLYGCAAFVSPLTNTCSTAALAGYSVANRARSVIATIYQNSTKANTTFISQAMGAEKIDKLKSGIKIGVTQGLTFFGVTMAVFAIFANKFTSLFLDPTTDTESFTVCVNIIRFLFPLIFFNVFNNLFHGIFRAVGSGKLMVISSFIYAISYIVYAHILFAVLPYELRIYGVHLALSGAYITEVIFAAYIFISGKWKSPEYIRLEQKMKNSQKA